MARFYKSIERAELGGARNTTRKQHGEDLLGGVIGTAIICSPGRESGISRRVRRPVSGEVSDSLSAPI
jgi:hypothetical protein